MPCRFGRLEDQPTQDAELDGGAAQDRADGGRWGNRRHEWSNCAGFDAPRRRNLHFAGCAGLGPALVFAVVGRFPAMATDRGPGTDLRNETVVNVAGLLKAPFGSARVYQLRLDRFPLDDEAVAADVRGEVKLTRLREAVIARVRASGAVALECVRCLRVYDQDFATEFDEEYRQTVDVRTGLGLAPGADEDEDTSRIDENHELDLADVLRQEILVALPMRPDCGEACPGPDTLTGGEDADQAEPEDERFAALARLLADDQTATPR